MHSGDGVVQLIYLSDGSSCAPEFVTETFEFTGAGQSFAVPANVCQVTVDAHGAQGGAGAEGIHIGGLGGRATASFAVTPGETLGVFVGGAGGDASTDSSTGAVDVDDQGPVVEAPVVAGGPGERVIAFGDNGGIAGAGGFNGGGDGGNTVEDPGGGGGGGSDVRRGNELLVVAGGGGGGGGDDDFPEGSGGAGGGTEGEPGEDSGEDPPSPGGGGGTQSAGGAGGANETASGEMGSAGTGGTGGDGNDDSGGGGGGGLFGGGGGAGDFENDLETDDGGGGGGGSGFGPAGVAFETGSRPGNGLITITYDARGRSCGAAPVAAPVAAAPRFTG